MMRFTSLRSDCARATLAVLISAPLLSACTSVTDYFEADEVTLSGERIAVRQQKTVSSEAVSVADSGITVVIPAAVPNTEWAQLNGGADRAIGHVSASGNLTQAWRTGLGGASGGRVVSPPVITGGRVYALDAAAGVSAVDASSGTVIWRRDLTPAGENARDGFGGGLAASGGRIYVSSGFGKLFALDAATGEVVWEGALRAPSRAAPVVSGGRVVAVTRENRIFAFDATSGEELWDQRGLEQTAGFLGGAAPAASGEVIVAPYSSGELNAYLASTGRPIWEEDLTGARGSGGLAALNDVTGDPVISDGIVYASSQSGRLVAISLRNGERIWTRDLAGSQAPYVAGNALFFVTNNGELLAIERDTGETAWSTELGAFSDPRTREDAIVWGGPILAGGRLLLVSNTRRMISVDPSNGAILGELSLPDGASTAPVAANGTVYVLTDDAALVAYR